MDNRRDREREREAVIIKDEKKGRARLAAGLLMTYDELAANFRAAVDIAAGEIGKDIKSKAVKRDLQTAVKLNLINQKLYPFEWLCRRFSLPITQKDFCRERERFCDRIFELLKKQAAGFEPTA